MRARFPGNRLDLAVQDHGRSERERVYHFSSAALQFGVERLNVRGGSFLDDVEIALVVNQQDVLLQSFRPLVQVVQAELALADHISLEVVDLGIVVIACDHGIEVGHHFRCGCRLLLFKAVIAQCRPQLGGVFDLNDRPVDGDVAVAGFGLVVPPLIQDDMDGFILVFLVCFNPSLRLRRCAVLQHVQRNRLDVRQRGTKGTDGQDHGHQHQKNKLSCAHFSLLLPELSLPIFIPHHKPRTQDIVFFLTWAK